jgi:aerobic-type carbon monoxide dehydrogenase small subunit (CoxS/CutS family)
VNGETSNYLCPYCTTRADSFEELKGHVLAVHNDEPVPLPQGMIALTVNGKDYQIHVEPEWTLNYLIHDKMGLTSPKMFCDRGACGSCTVIMNGRPILSCLSLAIECDGNTIETAEGIADADHPLVESYIKHHTMQCGYCTPGFITTAKALLDKNPNPTQAEIVESLSGNLCRCGTYPQHPKAILEAAQTLEEKGGI